MRFVQQDLDVATWRAYCSLVATKNGENAMFEETEESTVRKDPRHEAVMFALAAILTRGGTVAEMRKAVASVKR